MDKVKYLKGFSKHKILFFVFALCILQNNMRAQVNLAAGGTYTQNFDAALGTTTINPWTDNSTLTGWYITTTTLPINTGTINANSCYNFGIAGTNALTDRALGAISTATTHRFGVRLKNNGGTDITSYTINFTGEQWRSFNAGTLTFDYQTGATVTSVTAGAWTSVAALDFASLVTSAGAATDGNAAANRTAKSATISVTVIAGNEIFLRWTRAGSSSPGLAIDDITVNAVAAAGPAITAQPSNSTICTGNSTSFSITSATATSFAWESSANGSTGWAAVANGTPAGATYTNSTTSTLNITAAAATTYYYHCIATNAGGSTISSNGILTVNAVPGSSTAAAGTSVGASSFNANWSSVAGATGYYLDVSTVNTFASFVSGFNNLDVTNVTSYSVTGLSVSTTYYYRVRAYNTCGTSGNSSTITVTTTATTYCTSTGGTLSDGITNVTFNGINNSTASNIAYTDYTSTISTSISPNSTYNLSVSVNTGGNFTNYQMAWIDWNQDGDFADAGETFTLGTKTNSANGISSLCPLAITVPGTATIGTTRMRISSKYNAYATSCATGYDGEVEDYALIITGSTNTITSGAITGAPFSVTCTAGSTGTIAFTSTGTFSGNTYTAQLSNSSGSFVLPTNIGTLVSDANSGTINISIPSGMASGSGYVIRIIGDGPSTNGTASSSFTITLAGSSCSSFEIESILVDACGGSEGENEMVLFKVGAAALNTTNLVTTWPSNSWRGICQSAATASTVAAINATITGGGQLIEPTGGVLPANAQVLFFTSTAFNYATFDFTAVNSTLYVIFQCSGNTAGHFVNHKSVYTPRTLTLTFTGFGSDNVTYDANLVFNGDGAEVDFDSPGNATYTNSGGCKAPLTPLPIELLTFTATYNGINAVDLKWITASETNNDFFTIERSTDAAKFIPILKVNGAGNSSEILNYSDVDKNPNRGINYYRLKQTDFNGRTSYSQIVSVNVESAFSASIYPNPATSELNIKISTGLKEQANFEIINLQGVSLNKTTVQVEEDGLFSVDLKPYAAGAYILRMTIGNKTKQTLFIKQ